MSYHLRATISDPVADRLKKAVEESGRKEAFVVDLLLEEALDARDKAAKQARDAVDEQGIPY